MIHGVLFDFSGTLFRFEPGPGWPSGAHDETARARLVEVLTEPVALDGLLPPDVTELWHQRDLDPEAHRTVYMATLAHSGVALSEEEAESVYTSLTDPAGWQPYPDTAAVLTSLREKGIPVAVVSNIAWDIRPMFREHGLDEFVTEYVLSYVEGAAKPDPKIFTVACERIGADPANALMVGDSRENDGGAEAIGCPAVIVEPLPTARRPDALLAAVTARIP